MSRMPITLALCTLLGAPLVTPHLALAEPAGTPDRAAQAASPSRSPSDTGNATTVQRDAPMPARGVESNSPHTPMPMNLPDEAKASEVKGQYAMGIASLVIAGVFLAALVVGVLFIIGRRSWSTTH